MTSVLPGTLVQTLITSVHPHGLNLQVLGFFDGTVDRLHLDQDPASYKVGKKIKARILYEYSSSSPPKFALALVDHIVKLRARLGVNKTEAENGNSVQELYPVGTQLEAVKVLRLEAERGLIAEVAPGVEGFAHVGFFFRYRITIDNEFSPSRYLIFLMTMSHLSRHQDHGNLAPSIQLVSLASFPSMDFFSCR